MLARRDPFAWALWQNALLLAIFATAVGMTVSIATRGNAIAVAVAVVLSLLGMPTIVSYARIWSETFFLPFAVGVLASFDRYLVRDRWRWLILAGALSSLAMLTRYAGLSLFATGCLVLALAPDRSWRDRLRAIAIYAVVALPLSALWLIRNQVMSGTLTGNNELIHELTPDDLAEGVRTIGSWLVHDPVADPTQWPFALMFATAVLVATAVVVARVVRPARGDAILRFPPIVWICLAYVLVHVAFIAVANAFSTRAPPFNDRIVGPVFAPRRSRSS